MICKYNSLTILVHWNDQLLFAAKFNLFLAQGQNMQHPVRIDFFFLYAKIFDRNETKN